MMRYSPVLDKLTTLSCPIRVGDTFVFPIPVNRFSKEEIDMLRKEDNLSQQFGYGPLVANFLPDDIRPKGIPKM